MNWALISWDAQSFLFIYIKFQSFISHLQAVGGLYIRRIGSHTRGYSFCVPHPNLVGETLLVSHQTTTGLVIWKGDTIGNHGRLKYPGKQKGFGCRTQEATRWWSRSLWHLGGWQQDIAYMAGRFHSNQLFRSVNRKTWQTLQLKTMNHHARFRAAAKYHYWIASNPPL